MCRTRCQKNECFPKLPATATAQHLFAALQALPIRDIHIYIISRTTFQPDLNKHCITRGVVSARDPLCLNPWLLCADVMSENAQRRAQELECLVCMCAFSACIGFLLMFIVSCSF